MYQTISVDEFYQKHKKENLKVIDVREKDEYARGHIEAAANLPLSQLAREAASLDKSQPHYIICQSGGRSSQASNYLSELGYDVTNVMGGMSTWKGEVTR